MMSVLWNSIALVSVLLHNLKHYTKNNNLRCCKIVTHENFFPKTLHKSLCAAVTICFTLVNVQTDTHTHTQTAFERFIWEAPPDELKIWCTAKSWPLIISFQKFAHMMTLSDKFVFKAVLWDVSPHRWYVTRLWLFRLSCPVLLPYLRTDLWRSGCHFANGVTS